MKVIDKVSNCFLNFFSGIHLVFLLVHQGRPTFLLLKFTDRFKIVQGLHSKNVVCFL